MRQNLINEVLQLVCDLDRVGMGWTPRGAWAWRAEFGEGYARIAAPVGLELRTDPEGFDRKQVLDDLRLSLSEEVDRLTFAMHQVDALLREERS